MSESEVKSLDTSDSVEVSKAEGVEAPATTVEQKPTASPVTLAVAAPQKKRHGGRGVDRSTMTPEQLKAHRTVINNKYLAGKKAKEDKNAQRVNSLVEIKPKHAAELLRARGLVNEHVVHFCVELAKVAAEQNNIPFNTHLFNEGLRATLNKTKLAEIVGDDVVDGEVLYRKDLQALWDFGYWRHPEVAFEQWLAERLRYKSSMFELSQLHGKTDFGETHRAWERFLPRWSPLGLRSDYSQQEGLAWLGAQRSDTEGDKKKYLLVCSRNSFKSTAIRLHALQLALCYPDARIAIFSETNKLSKKGMKEFRGYVEINIHNPSEFQQLFGEVCVKPDDGSNLTYENPLAHLGLPQSTLEQSSLESSNVGSRFDYGIYDDPISRDFGTSNDEQKEAALSKWGAIQRLREPSGFSVNVQTPWEIGDLGAVMISQNEKDPERPLAVRIDPVMTIKPEARGKGWLELTQDDVVLNFLPKLNWRFVRDEMRSAEGLKFFRTQYMCEWIEEAEVLRVHFDIDELRARTRHLAFFGNPIGAQTVLSLDRAYSTASRYADRSVLCIGKVQPVEGNNALVIWDLRAERWRESDVVKNAIELIEKYQPTLFIAEQDKGWESMCDAIRNGCLRRGIPVPYFRWKPIRATSRSKATRAKRLELPISDGRVYFVSASWNDLVYEEFSKFDGVTKSNGYRHDDTVDAISIMFEEVGPKYQTEISTDEVEASKRLREEEDQEIRRRAQYNAMFGPQYTPPPKIVESAPSPQPRDERLRVFGSRGPWRL